MRSDGKEEEKSWSRYYEKLLEDGLVDFRGNGTRLVR